MNRLCWITATSMLALLAACSTRIEITNAGVQEVAALGKNLKIVTTQKSIESTQPPQQSNRNGYYLVQLIAQVDLERVISEKEMASLYYRLQDCDEPKNSPELLSGPVFVNTMATIKESNRFSYYAAVPRNIEDEISQFQAMLGNSSEVKSSSICIRLGAGNMAGEVLVSNLVPLGIGSQVSD